MRLAAAIVSVLLCASAYAELRFTSADLKGWSTRSFAGSTDYEIVMKDGRNALRARARNAASARYREVEIDLAETPYLVWSWQLEMFPESQRSERTRKGDDYALRIYVVHKGWLGRLSARALNYVWSRSEVPETQWPNAFTDRTRMVAVNSGSHRKDEWVTHSRDLRRDWHAAFGDQVQILHGVALMTDTDNTGSAAAGYYGTIRFCGSPHCAEMPQVQRARPP